MLPDKFQYSLKTTQTSHKYTQPPYGTRSIHFASELEHNTIQSPSGALCAEQVGFFIPVPTEIPFCVSLQGLVGMYHFSNSHTASISSQQIALSPPLPLPFCLSLCCYICALVLHEPVEMEKKVSYHHRPRCLPHPSPYSSTVPFVRTTPSIPKIAEAVIRFVCASFGVKSLLLLYCPFSVPWLILSAPSDTVTLRTYAWSAIFFPHTVATWYSCHQCTRNDPSKHSKKSSNMNSLFFFFLSR